jgi:MFS family permease
MLLEISCVIGLFWFAVSLIKEKDLSYVVGFVFGFLIGVWVESYGILTNVWEYQNIASPFNYPIYGVPVGIVLLYASITSLAVFLNKFFAGAREKHKDKLDRYVGYISTVTGVVLFLLSQAFGIHYFIGLSFIMIGLYMFVKNPVMFYVGATALAADFIFEHSLVLNNQISYAVSYGYISVGFFLGGAIFSALFILIGRRLSFSKNARK